MTSRPDLKPPTFPTMASNSTGGIPLKSAFSSMFVCSASWGRSLAQYGRLFCVRASKSRPGTIRTAAGVQGRPEKDGGQRKWTACTILDRFGHRNIAGSGEDVTRV